MDNNYIPDTEVIETAAATEEVRSKRKGRAHIVIDTIFVGLATAAFVFYAIYVGQFIGLVSKPVEGWEGLGVAVLLIAVLFVGAISLVLSAVAVILSGVGIKVQSGWKRFVCIGFTALSGFFVFATVALFLIGLIINESVQLGNSAALIMPAYL